MNIFLIDAIGPFFRDYQKQKINWSKIPFENLRIDEENRRKTFDRLAADMAAFAEKVRAIGYNAVSLDDVAHLAPDPWLEETTNETIHLFRQEYKKLFAIIRARDLKIFLTMDILSYTPQLRSHISTNKARGFAFIRRQVEEIFSSFPEVSGIIFRIGECDGKDVKGIFKSELFLKTAKEVNHLVRFLLPAFERCGRTLVLRTWTIGAYRIGDLIWHHRTTARVLEGIDSDHFVLSMKYGESDFFRYLPLNRHFFKFKVGKIIELQARREYEGCGEYPSFIGWDYHRYAEELQSAENMVGISVWCQTGGWVPFRRLTFLEPEGIWNELNAYVTIKIFKDRWAVEQAIEAFCSAAGWKQKEAVLEFLKLNDQVIKKLLYIEEVAAQKLFFRRVRIPPLLNVYWNNIFISYSVRIILLSLVENRQQTIIDGHAALEKIGEMKRLAQRAGLPVDDVRYMEDTFSILALARNYYFEPDGDLEQPRIRKAKRRYKKRYPKNRRPRYRIRTSYQPVPLGMRQLTLMLKIALRTKRGYRIVDHLFTINLLGSCYRLMVRLNPKLIPKFARKQAMGIGSIFR